MIVTLTDTGYDVVFQPAHGLLAAKLASHWRVAERPRYWLEFLTAVARHDNNQRDFHGRDKLTKAGAPRGFTVSKSESETSSLEQPRKTVREAFYQGCYGALMTSLHVSRLYESRRGSSNELDAFLDEQRANQTKWRKTLGLKKSEAEHDYRIMLWCDRCSLVLCQDGVPAAGRQLEIELLPEGERSYLFGRDDGSLGVEPWPFEEQVISVDVEVHELTELSYPSDEALLQALHNAEVGYHRWTFRT